MDFISDSGSLLYHKESSSYPKNNYNSIESIELYKGDENKIIKDKTCIENLLSTINGKKSKNSSSKTDEVLYSISIHYKDYPASYSLGELVKCESGNYKIVDNYGHCYNLNADILSANHWKHFPDVNQVNILDTKTLRYTWCQLIWKHHHAHNVIIVRFFYSLLHQFDPTQDEMQFPHKSVYAQFL